MTGRSASARSSRTVSPAAPAVPRRRCGGFTLLELLLVLMVVALAGALVFPDLNPALRSTREEAALRRTVSLLDDLRRRAVATGKVLTVSRGERGESLEVAVPGEDGEEVLREPLPGGVEALSLEPAESRYYPQGHSSGLTLTVRTEGGREARLEVGSFTGLARVVPED